MAFFKKWKNSSKHRKLSEEWALATSLKDFSEQQDDIDNDADPETFSIKYLGNTIIESARSEEATAEAIKSVISTAKATRRKLQRVNLSVSPKGIEMFDHVTGESLMQVSIYKISYCSADAAHSDVFAFVGSEDIDISKAEEQLVCYAYLCPKRKIAQKVTLTVARSFEQAYAIWRDAAQRKKFQLERLNRQNSRQSVNSRNTHCADNRGNIRNVLIDFSSEISAEICSKDHRELLQNTWVSFEDTAEVQHSESNLLQDNNSWENKLINCA